MSGRAAALRSCSGILRRGGPELTRCWCHQPALGANREGVPRSATLCCRHVTVRAQPHPREWALHGGFQAAPRSPHYWSRGRPGPSNCAFCWGGGAERQIDAVRPPIAARRSHLRRRPERDYSTAVVGVVHPGFSFCLSPSPAQRP